MEFGIGDVGLICDPVQNLDLQRVFPHGEVLHRDLSHDHYPLTRCKLHGFALRILEILHHLVAGFDEVGNLQRRFRG